MQAAGPATELDGRFSSPGATPRPWAEVEALLGHAGLYWLTTVRPDGRPHVTPLIAVWLDGALFFCTGGEERKAKNLARNAACVLTTGCNTADEGLDAVVEGDAVRTRDHDLLRRLAGAYVAKYGQDWAFTVVDGAFEHGGDTALVFEVRPRTVFGFGKGEPYSQTRYRFGMTKGSDRG
ncbi:MAG: pyridoxamine 5'-phosphate oxidase family protein [Actinomycetota bacterium]